MKASMIFALAAASLAYAAPAESGAEGKKATDNAAPKTDQEVISITDFIVHKSTDKGHDQLKVLNFNITSPAAKAPIACRAGHLDFPSSGAINCTNPEYSYIVGTPLHDDLPYAISVYHKITPSVVYSGVDNFTLICYPGGSAHDFNCKADTFNLTLAQHPGPSSIIY